MKTVEEFLAFQLSQDRLSNAIQNAQIVTDSSEEPWLVFDIATVKKSSQPYKKKLIDILWAPLETVYQTYIAANMLRQGYICVPIDGGHVVVSPEGKEYQLSAEGHSCTCEHVILGNADGPCKHQNFRDWHAAYRARVNEYKRQHLS